MFFPREKNKWQPRKEKMATQKRKNVNPEKEKCKPRKGQFSEFSGIFFFSQKKYFAEFFSQKKYFSPDFSAEYFFQIKKIFFPRFFSGIFSKIFFQSRKNIFFSGIFINLKFHPHSCLQTHQMPRQPAPFLPPKLHPQCM